MKQYRCTKTVKAEPMTRGDYNLYRGWKVPENENPNDEGYLVEYMDSAESNHDNHIGYISWSPKAQFDNGYYELGAQKKSRILTRTENGGFVRVHVCTGRGNNSNRVLGIFAKWLSGRLRRVGMCGPERVQ